MYKKEEWRSRRLSANGKISIGSCESADNPIGQMVMDSENMERKMQRNLCMKKHKVYLQDLLNEYPELEDYQKFYTYAKHVKRKKHQNR